MKYWLNLFSPETWNKFQENDCSVTGFRQRQETAAAHVQPGDVMLCYMIKLSRWCGVLEVTSKSYTDKTPIFKDEKDPFIIRFECKPKVIQEPEFSIPMMEKEIWDNFSKAQGVEIGQQGWAQFLGLRQSLIEINEKDAVLLIGALKEQQKLKKKYPLSKSEERAIKPQAL